jgi:cytochrome c oxidase assembly factor CtaG
MKPHVHMSPVFILVVVAAVLAVFGTTHLFTLTRDDRFSRAWRSLNP